MIGSHFIIVLHMLLVPGTVAPTSPTAQNGTQSASVISGVVHDAGGGVVPGAVVLVRSASGAQRQTITLNDGTFSIAPPTGGEVTLIVEVSGFAPARRVIAASETRRQGLDIVLQAAGVSETVLVTPTRSEERLGDVPASVSVVDRDDIRRAPAVVADDILRQIPTFSLFRRSNSISAHPTSQGVSLRGIAPSGVSRTLVMVDGVPYNDAFGGWVYWTGLPIEGAQRIEVVDGASSSLYGNYAMGGVINIVTAPPARRTVDVRTQYGNRSSPKFDFHATDVWKKLGVSVDGSFFDTDGYPNVPVTNPDGSTSGARGPIDNNLTVNFKNIGVKLDYAASERVHAFLRTGYFKEDRNNGKMSTVPPALTPEEEANRTRWNYTSGGVRIRLADSSEIQATGFADVKTFNANFMAVPNAVTRATGRFTLIQEVPSTSYGGMVQWTKALASRQVLSAGFDIRRVDGDSIEDGLDAATGSTVTTHRVAGGTQSNVGVFVQDVITAMDRLTLTLGARVDSWKNIDAHNTVTTIASGAVDDPDLPDKSDSVVSPRAGARYRVSDRVSVWADVATGFRAPTLNELYRRFSQGTTLTLANPELGPERLKGGEVGVSVMPARGLTWRATYFDNRVKDPVANLTITPNVPGFTTTLQRNNLGRTRIWGAQTDAEYRIGTRFKFAGAYMYNIALVKDAPQNPGLVNNCQGVAGKACTLQQVPKHRGSFEASFADPKWFTAALYVQATGLQFDDDLNVRVVPGYDSTPGLPKYTVIGLSVSRAISSNIDVFMSAQNLMDKAFYVGTQPVLTGSPRLVSGGLRIMFQGR